MAIPLKDLHVLALTPVEGCPQGLEPAWLTIILHALVATFRRQCQPHPDDDMDHLDALFCCLAEQWNNMRALALTRGVTLDPAERTELTVDEFRAVCFEAAALDAMHPVDAA